MAGAAWQRRQMWLANNGDPEALAWRDRKNAGKRKNYADLKAKAEAGDLRAIEALQRRRTQNRLSSVRQKADYANLREMRDRLESQGEAVESNMGREEGDSEGLRWMRDRPQSHAARHERTVRKKQEGQNMTNLTRPLYANGLPVDAKEDGDETGEFQNYRAVDRLRRTDQADPEGHTEPENIQTGDNEAMAGDAVHDPVEDFHHTVSSDSEHSAMAAPRAESRDGSEMDVDEEETEEEVRLRIRMLEVERVRVSFNTNTYIFRLPLTLVIRNRRRSAWS